MDFRSLTNEFQDADRRHREEVARVDVRAVGSGLATFARRMAIVMACLLAFYFLLCVPIAWYQTTLIYWNGGKAMSEGGMPEGWRMRRYVSQTHGIDYASYVHEGKPGTPTVVYLHGRGETFRIVEWNVGHYLDLGWTVVVPEYPGFAGLAGKPDERIIGVEMGIVHQDLMERGVRADRLLIHGNSLGAGPAMQLAQYPNGFLFLSAPVASMKEVVGTYLPYYPTILLHDKWDNLARARTRYPSHAEVVHARDDMVVPVSQGRMLSKAAVARYRELASGGHAIAGENREIGVDAKGRFTLSGKRVGL